MLKIRVSGILLIAASLALTSCGLFVENRQDSWYPHYSTFWARSSKNPLVFIHGFGGEFGTFRSLPLELGLVETRGLFYFTYDSGAFQRSAEHISRVASRFREFLQTNIFDQAPEARVDIVAHSTGGLIARDYIVNNPYNHRVANLVLVGVPNYGAYWAGLKDAIFGGGFLAGDFQAKELQHGSHTLFFLQRRWDCLWKLYEAQETLREGKDPAPPRLRDPWDLEKQENWAFLPQCVFYNQLLPMEGLPPDADWVRLPRILAIMGTSKWRDAFAFRFSDGVVRLESGVLDERFLFPSAGAKDGPGVIYVRHGHWRESGYFGRAGRAEVSHIVSTFLSYPKPSPEGEGRGLPCPQSRYLELLDCYTGLRKEQEKQVNVTAYWIRVSDLVGPCWKALREAEPRVEIRVEPLALDRPLLEMIPQNWTRRRKTLFSGDSWIEYQRYVLLDGPGADRPKVEITVTPGKGKGLAPVRFEARMRLLPGRTTILDCRVGEGRCYDITGREKEGAWYPNHDQRKSLERYCEAGKLFSPERWKRGP